MRTHTRVRSRTPGLEFHLVLPPNSRVISFKNFSEPQFLHPEMVLTTPTLQNIHET